MAEENSVQAETQIAGTEPKVKPKRAPSQRKTAAPAKATPNAATANTPGSKVRKYSADERAEKLTMIQSLLSVGKSTLKDALKQVGITEQTYYNWKKAAQPASQKTAEPVSQGDDLKDLLDLEEENKRLRKILAERLRAENAELRKRLGMD
ncbi:transposase [Sinorhizobium meliloti]|uniref:transposase n=1 Tax=Rhizobium meliloti TaxID=382 RepID=UPI003F17A5CF